MKYFLLAVFAIAAALTNTSLAQSTYDSYMGVVEADMGDTFYVIYDTQHNAAVTIVTPTEYEINYDYLTLVPEADGDFSLQFAKNGKRFAYFNHLAGDTYWFTYGKEKLHITFNK